MPRPQKVLCKGCYEMYQKAFDVVVHNHVSAVAKTLQAQRESKNAWDEAISKYGFLVPGTLEDVHAATWMYRAEYLACKAAEARPRHIYEAWELGMEEWKKQHEAYPAAIEQDATIACAFDPSSYY